MTASLLGDGEALKHTRCAGSNGVQSDIWVINVVGDGMLGSLREISGETCHQVKGAGVRAFVVPQD